VFTDKAFGGQAHLTLLSGITLRGSPWLIPLAARGLAGHDVGGFSRFRRPVRHTQIRAKDVNDGLASIRIGLREVHQGVQGTEANRGLIVAELLDCPGVQLVDLLSPPKVVRAVLLDPVLPEGAVGDDQAPGHSKPSQGLHQCGPDVVLGLELLFGGYPFVRESGEQPRAHHQSEHDEKRPNEADKRPEPRRDDPLPLGQ
jgi:hypothetical protein